MAGAASPAATQRISSTSSRCGAPAVMVGACAKNTLFSFVRSAGPGLARNADSGTTTRVHADAGTPATNSDIGCVGLRWLFASSRKKSGRSAAPIADGDHTANTSVS